MKYEQEDLLEKFIQNEKKSKFWALLSAVAFTLVAVTIVFVAKEVKGGPKNKNNGLDGNSKDTVYKTDTFLLTKNDPKINEQLIYLRDSLIKTQKQYKETHTANEKLTKDIKKIYERYSKCDSDYMRVYEDLVNLQMKLTECENKPAPPVSKQVSIVIKYYSQVPDSTVDRLQEFLNNSKTKINFSRQKVQKELKAVIVYFNKDDKKMADYISKIINDPSKFRTKIKYSSYLITNGDKPAGNFEIWLTNIY